MSRSLTRRFGATVVALAAVMVTSLSIAAPAGAAGAAPRVTSETSVPLLTGPADFTTTTSTVLTGLVQTGGEPTVWAFEYSTSPAYLNATFTTPKAIAGSTAKPSEPTVVDSSVTGLKPGTTYYYRLLAEPIGSAEFGYYYTALSAGASATFKTSSAGTLTLSTGTVKVKKSKFAITVTSKSTLTAKGKLTISAKVGKKTDTIASSSFTVNAKKKKTLTLTLTKTGKTLLAKAKGGKLKVTEKATTTTYQPTVTKTITLKG
jgi:hypothetical protein